MSARHRSNDVDGWFLYETQPFRWQSTYNAPWRRGGQSWSKELAVAAKVRSSRNPRSHVKATAIQYARDTCVRVASHDDIPVQWASDGRKETQGKKETSLSPLSLTMSQIPILLLLFQTIKLHTFALCIRAKGGGSIWSHTKEGGGGGGGGTRRKWAKGAAPRRLPHRQLRPSLVVSRSASRQISTSRSDSRQLLTKITITLFLQSTQCHQLNLFVCWTFCPSTFVFWSACWMSLSSLFLCREAIEEEGDECGNAATFYVKVYMEGIPIGRKLDLLAHDGYCDLIRTLDNMFNTNIMCKYQVSQVFFFVLFCSFFLFSWVIFFSGFAFTKNVFSCF